MVLLPLCAQNPDALEKRSAELEAQYQYEDALKTLTQAVELQGQLSGDQSADYGLALLKLGALERKTGHPDAAGKHYAQAVRLLPGRPETAPVFLFLAIEAVSVKRYPQAVDYLQRAKTMDIGLTGPATMWTAYMYERQGQAEQAEAAYKAALALESSESLERLETTTLYRRFLEDQGRDDEAKALATPSPRPAPIPRAAPVPRTERTSTDSQTGAYRVGGEVTKPSVILKVDPQYSEEARAAKLSASVLVQLVVGADGNPTNMKIVKRAGFGLDDCAVSTIAKWKFKPGEKDGKPVAVFATVEVNFRLL
jgi:TonB family protein